MKEERTPVPQESATILAKHLAQRERGAKDGGRPGEERPRSPWEDSAKYEDLTASQKSFLKQLMDACFRGGMAHTEREAVLQVRVATEARDGFLLSLGGPVEAGGARTLHEALNQDDTLHD